MVSKSETLKTEINLTVYNEEKRHFCSTVTFSLSAMYRKMASRKHCRKKYQLQNAFTRKRNQLWMPVWVRKYSEKLYPVAKYKRCKLWVPGQKVPYLQCMKQVYISLGVNVIIGFISSTSDEMKKHSESKQQCPLVISHCARRSLF